MEEGADTASQDVDNGILDLILFDVPAVELQSIQVIEDCSRRAKIRNRNQVTECTVVFCLFPYIRLTGHMILNGFLMTSIPT